MANKIEIFLMKLARHWALFFFLLWFFSSQGWEDPLTTHSQGLVGGFFLGTMWVIGWYGSKKN